MAVILNKVGAQDGKWTGVIADAERKEYITQLSLRVPATVSIKDLGITHPDLEGLLVKMLQFNPYLRSSASELLNHEFFNEIRDPGLEKQCLPLLDIQIAKDKATEFQTRTPKVPLSALQKQLIARILNLQQNFE